MLAVHLENGAVTTRDLPVPPRPEGFALLRLLCGGICNTDLELQRGYYGFAGTPGHEFVAEVVEADTPASPASAWWAKSTWPAPTANGAAAAWAATAPTAPCWASSTTPAPSRNSSPCRSATCTCCPTTFPPSRAVFLEPLAAACEILDQVAIPRGEQVAVLGDGKLGLLVAMVLNAHGYRVHQFGRHAAETAPSPRAPESQPKSPRAPPHRRLRLGGGRHRQPEGLRTAAAMTRPRGTVILKSTVHGAVPVDTAPIIVNELTLVGSRCGRFEAALPLIAHHLIRVDDLIADRFPLAEAPQAFARAAEKGVLKVLLK